MPDMQSALLARLKTDAGVAAISTRHHWKIVPQNAVLPYSRLTRAGGRRDQHLKAYQRTRRERVQIDAMASTYAEASALAEAMIEAVATPAEIEGVRFGRTAAGNPRDDGEDVPGKGYVYRTSVDLLVEYALI